ncbi:hypothetical protein Q757_06815 [Oenococcus alcoholitolerans]|uniref:Arginyl-tRNA synthetase catalytic core domain-containing protein n=1 Tax=Oenococcus alcoholitolerans TaxID=931074 RepID=A0ABR4XPW5_9LACO|nr:hypothetical protein Q757_06815 [Oenococcus alcoholitolerans]
MAKLSIMIKMQPVVQMLKEKNLLVPSQGAQIVDLPKLLPDENFPIAMIVRSDGATQYITRDLASAIYRYDHYHFSHALYVVGNEQKDHFDQMKAILKLAGDDWSDGIEHIGFGLITMNGKKCPHVKETLWLYRTFLILLTSWPVNKFQKKIPI